MKNLILTLVLLITYCGYSQTYTIEDKAVTGVFEVQGKTKAQIYSAVIKWISINYNSGKSVTQLADVDGGNIIVKGINEISYPNNTKILYPNMKTPETSIMKFNHLIEINIRDNKFRINYKIIDVYYEASVLPYMTPEMIKSNFDSINLNGIPEPTMLELCNTMDTNLKKGFIGQEKRTNYITGMKQMYIDLNLNLISNIKTTMTSIQTAATTPATDGW